MTSCMCARHSLPSVTILELAWMMGTSHHHPTLVGGRTIKTPPSRPFLRNKETAFHFLMESGTHEQFRVECENIFFFSFGVSVIPFSDRYRVPCMDLLILPFLFWWGLFRGVSHALRLRHLCSFPTIYPTQLHTRRNLCTRGETLAHSCNNIFSALKSGWHV